MKKSPYALITYSNYELKFSMYKIYNSVPFLQLDELIEKVDLTSLSNDYERDEIVKKIQLVLAHAKKLANLQNIDVYVILDAEEYYHNEKCYTFEYETPQVIEQKNIDKIIEHALYQEEQPDGFKAVSFEVKSIVPNKTHPVENVVGLQVESLTITGDIVVCDGPSYYELMNLLNRVDTNILKTYVGGYLIRHGLNITPGDGFMEVCTNSINFILNDNGNIKQTSVKIGMKKILEDLYMKLVEVHSPEASEEAVRFIMEYFTLQSYPIDVEIIKGISLNQLISEFKELLIGYFQYIFNELASQGIVVNNMQIIVQDYPQVDFIEVLNEALTINFTTVEILQRKNIKKENLKAFYLVQKLCEEKIQLERRGHNE